MGRGGGGGGESASAIRRDSVLNEVRACVCARARALYKIGFIVVGMKRISTGSGKVFTVRLTP